MYIHSIETVQQYDDTAQFIVPRKIACQFTFEKKQKYQYLFQYLQRKKCK